MGYRASRIAAALLLLASLITFTQQSRVTLGLGVIESKEPDYMLSISLREGNWEPP